MHRDQALDVIVKIVSHRTVNLDEYASIPISYESFTKIHLEGALDRFKIQALTNKIIKDYDQDDTNSPQKWPQKFDLSNWGFILAFQGDQPVGAATIALRTGGLDILEGRNDLAVLWDIRVVPDLRQQGIGSLLWRAAEKWCVEQSCTTLKVETQDINPTACFFYLNAGCSLKRTNPGAYADFPDEIQLLWYKDLIALESDH